MNPAAWEALLRHIRPEIHEKLMLVTASGTEITIQTIVRIEREFVVLKGRLAGTQDAGRIFFLPYAAIDYFGSQKVVKDVEFTEWFGNLVIPTSAQPETRPAAAAPAGAAVAPAAPDPAAAEAEPAPPAAPSGNSKTVNPVVKSAVLEKFRARSKGSGLRPKVVTPPPQ
jgi:hypothetical protein